MSKPNLKSLLQEIVAIPSVTGDYEHCREVTTWSAEKLKQAGVAHIKTGDVNDVPYLVASTRQPNKDTIWFVCHLDVVPGSQKLFELRDDGTNYYGRGVCDMKGMFIGALAAMFQQNDPSATNVGFMLTTDEEVGGRNGVGALVNKSFTGAAAYVLDQSSHWVLGERMKGIIWMRVTAQGKAAHGARPWLGHNANVELLHFLHDFGEWFYANITQSHPENYYTTYNLGMIRGGEATNQVPADAVANIDIRFVHEDEAQLVIKAAQKLAEGKPIAVDVLMHEPSVESDPTETWHQRTKQYMQELGLTPDPKKGEALGHGTTDGRYFVPSNVPVISFRSPSGGQHSEEEWASIQGLNDLQALCSKLISATKM